MNNKKRVGFEFSLKEESLYRTIKQTFLGKNDRFT